MVSIRWKKWVCLGTLMLGSPGAIAAAPASGFSVLTYNVEGLPWPVRMDRAEKLGQIGDTLRALRDRGAQPHVIVLQEAFSPDAKAIATRAGYRYIADGPSRDMSGGNAALPADRRFEADASALRGETEGKWADSGLRIASDYPILAVRRMAYPTYACAGLDCLANKGVLAVSLRVPGAPEPIVVVATHLNSRRASHAADARSFHAYQRQLDLLSQFVRRVVPAQYPLVLAGDLNVGKRFDRQSYLVRKMVGWRDGAPVSIAMNTCLDDAACSKTNDADIRFSSLRARDWQFFSPGRQTSLRVTALAGLFGHDASGAMLSDHVGYVASYRFEPAAMVRNIAIAAR